MTEVSSTVVDTNGAQRPLKSPQMPTAKSHSFSAVPRILFELCEEPEIGILELARRARVSVGMAQRITAALVDANLLAWSQYTRKYSLGAGVLRLSSAYTQTAPELKCCIAELEQLARLTGETVAVHRRIGKHRVIVAQVESRHDLTWRGDMGRAYPLHTGAASKALLAFVPIAELDELLLDHKFDQFQPATPRNRVELDVHLAEIRRIGVAVSFGERVLGAGGVAAPVFGVGGRSEYALSVYGPEHRIRPVVDQLIKTVRDAAVRASNGK